MAMWESISAHAYGQVLSLLCIVGFAPVQTVGPLTFVRRYGYC